MPALHWNHSLSQLRQASTKEWNKLSPKWRQKEIGTAHRRGSETSLQIIWVLRSKTSTVGIWSKLKIVKQAADTIPLVAIPSENIEILNMQTIQARKNRLNNQAKCLLKLLRALFLKFKNCQQKNKIFLIKAIIKSKQNQNPNKLAKLLKKIIRTKVKKISMT